MAQLVRERKTVHPSDAQVGQRRRAVALGETLAGRVRQQRVVAILGGRQVEQRLEQAVDVGAVEQVDAADDVGHPLRGIVDRDREVVARRRVLAGKDDVAVGSGVGKGRAGAGVGAC